MSNVDLQGTQPPALADDPIADQQSSSVSDDDESSSDDSVDSWDSQPRKTKKFRIGERQSRRVKLLDKSKQVGKARAGSRRLAVKAGSCSSLDASETSDSDDGSGSESKDETPPTRPITEAEAQSDTQAIMNMEEMACIMEFLWVFRRLLGVELGFSLHSLVDALVRSPGPGLLARLHTQLLQGLVSSKALSQENWPHYLALRCKLWARTLSKPQGQQPFQAAKGQEAAAYAALPASDRVRALKLLCDLRLEREDLSSAVEAALVEGAARAKAGKPPPPKPALPAVAVRRTRGSTAPPAAPSAGSSSAPAKGGRQGGMEQQEGSQLELEVLRRQPLGQWGEDGSGRSYWWLDWCEAGGLEGGWQCGSMLARQAAPQPATKSSAEEEVGVQTPARPPAPGLSAAVAPQAAGVTSQAAGVTSQAAGVTSQAAGVTSQAAGVTSQAAGVTSQAAGVTSQAAGVTSQAAGVTSQAAGVTSQAAGVTSQAAGVTSQAVALGSHPSTAHQTAAPVLAAPEPIAAAAAAVSSIDSTALQAEPQQEQQQQPGVKRQRGSDPGSKPPSQQQLPGQQQQDQHPETAAELAVIQANGNGRGPDSLAATSDAVMQIAAAMTAASHRTKRACATKPSPGAAAAGRQGGLAPSAGGGSAKQPKPGGMAGGGAGVGSAAAGRAQGKEASKVESGQGRSGKHEKLRGSKVAGSKGKAGQAAVRPHQAYRLPPQVLGGRWEVVATSQAELEAAAADLALSDHPADKQLAEQISGVLVAELQARVDAAERWRKAQERAAKALGVQLGGIIYDRGRTRKPVNYSQSQVGSQQPAAALKLDQGGYDKVMREALRDARLDPPDGQAGRDKRTRAARGPSAARPESHSSSKEETRNKHGNSRRSSKGEEARQEQEAEEPPGPDEAQAAEPAMTTLATAEGEKGREAMAQRRTAEAEAKALALAAEAEAQALADAGAYEAQLHRLQADLQQREQQLADNQRLLQPQQQVLDLQRDELQRKEQQVAQQLTALLHREQQLTEQQQQLQADLHLREQQVAEQQHQLLQQHADMHLREKQVAEQQHQLQQQQADLQLREQQVAQQKHQVQQQQADLQLREQQVAQQKHQVQQQLNRLQQQLEAQSGAELQRQVQQQLAALQHQQADQQAVSTNHPLPDHPTCSPLIPKSLRSPLLTTPGHNTHAHAFSASKVRMPSQAPTHHTSHKP
ncbi:hypothetical protein QJQ45_027704 [Haematococcus lacustris]|nr:hypothetical protein QJQ45_027704 [Haematococcus lacustris]